MQLKETFYPKNENHQDCKLNPGIVGKFIKSIPIAKNRSLTFIAVLAEVSMNNKPFSSA